MTKSNRFHLLLWRIRKTTWLSTVSIYIDDKQQEWFVKEWKKTGKKLDMGKSCVRFKKLEDVALDVLAKLTRRCSVEKYIELYEKQLAATRKK